MDEVVPLAVEMQAIGFHPAQPVGFFSHGPMQWEERDAGIATGFSQHRFVGLHVQIAVPEAVGKGHDVLIHGCEANHQDLGQRFHFTEQLSHAESIGLGGQLLAAIRPAHPCRVVQSDCQQHTVRCLPPQLAATLPLPPPAGGHPFQSIAADAQGIDHRGRRQLHPLPAQAFAPAPGLTISPAIHAAVADHQQLFGFHALS